MLIDVEDPVRNLVLNACFYSIYLLTLVSIVPWRTLGTVRLSNLLRWLSVPVIGLAMAYELAMPSRFDIRIDLFLLLPAYGLVIVTSVVRWLAWKRIQGSRLAR